MNQNDNMQVAKTPTWALLLRRCVLGLAKLFSLFTAKEVWLLLIIIMLLFFAAWWLLTDKHGEEATTAAFQMLFNVSSVKGPCVGWRMAIYVLVWLLGGGVLVSAMVKQYERINDCEYRLFRWLLGRMDHVVIFGWNSAVISFLQHDVTSGRNSLVVILTMSDSKAIRASLHAIGVRHHLIYRAEYDDGRELKKNLCLGSKNCLAIYAAGEGESSAHDARVIRLMSELLNERKLYCNIHDFGLADRCIVSEPGKSIRYLNFHRNWGDGVSQDIGICDRLYLIGFGAMGQAVALSYLRHNPTGKVIVTDPNEDKRKLETKRFKDLFAKEGNGLESCAMKEEKGEDKKTGKQDDAEGEWWKKIADDHEPKVVVVAIRKAEKSLSYLSHVIHVLKEQKGNRYYLSQEIDGPVGKGVEKMDLFGQPVTVFGMNRGAPWQD